jgi:carbon monoxide dehydrogenase subunit G
MGMLVTRTVLIRAPAEKVWELLTSPSRVARCLPGAELLGQLNDTTYVGRLVITFGPIPVSYEGTVTFDRIDRSTWTTVVRGLGREAQSGGTSDMSVTTRLVPRSSRQTEVAVQAEVTATGIFTHFGAGAIRGMTELMFDRFAAAMRGDLQEAGPAQEPLPDVSLPIQAQADLGGAASESASVNCDATAPRPGSHFSAPPDAVLLWRRAGGRMLHRLPFHLSVSGAIAVILLGLLLFAWL